MPQRTVSGALRHSVKTGWGPDVRYVNGLAAGITYFVSAIACYTVLHVYCLLTNGIIAV
jgi:hypothetical protein